MAAMTDFRGEKDLLWKQFNTQVELYKFFFDWVLKLDVFYYTITGAIASFYLSRPGDGLLRYSLALPIVLSILLLSLFNKGRKGVRSAGEEMEAIRQKLELEMKFETKYLPSFLLVNVVMCAIIALALSVLLLPGLVSPLVGLRPTEMRHADPPENSARGTTEAGMGSNSLPLSNPSGATPSNQGSVGALGHNQGKERQEAQRALWTDKAQAIASIVGVAIALAGVIFVSYQIRQISRSSRAGAHSAIFSHYLEVTRLVLENPGVRPYLYESKTFPDEIDDSLKSKVLVTCEALCDFYEHVSLQRENLPKQSLICWDKAIARRYEGNPVVKDYLETHRHTYAQDLFSSIERGRRLLPRKPNPGTQADG